MKHTAAVMSYITINLTIIAEIDIVTVTATSISRHFLTYQITYSYLVNPIIRMCNTA